VRQCNSERAIVRYLLNLVRAAIRGAAAVVEDSPLFFSEGNISALLNTCFLLTLFVEDDLVITEFDIYHIF